MKYTKEIKEFIGTAKYDEWGGGYIWGNNQKGLASGRQVYQTEWRL